MQVRYRHSMQLLYQNYKKIYLKQLDLLTQFTKLKYYLLTFFPKY